MRSIRRTPLVLLAVGALALTACAGDEADAPGDTASPDAALGIRSADTPYHEAADTEEVDGEIRWAGARSGHQAVRIRGDGAGQGLRPEGGGTPWTVTHAQDEGCVQLRRGGPTDDVADEVCDLDPAEGASLFAHDAIRAPIDVLPGMPPAR